MRDARPSRRGSSDVNDDGDDDGGDDKDGAES